MDQEQIKINDDTGEDGVFAMIGDFYSKKMLSIVIIVWVWAIIFIAGIVYSGSKFFDAGEVKLQIMYAAIFICCFQGICLMKIFAWMMIYRNSIIRKINKLQLRIADRNETVKRDS